ncbi:MAG: hypothetical protein WAN66_18100 [Limnoraphis robusta]
MRHFIDGVLRSPQIASAEYAQDLHLAPLRLSLGLSSFDLM